MAVSAYSGLKSRSVGKATMVEVDMFVSGKFLPLTSVWGLYPCSSVAPMNAGLNETRSSKYNSEESGMLLYYCVRMPRNPRFYGFLKLAIEQSAGL